MEKNIKDYEPPVVSITILKYDGVLCLSGSHEGTSEEDWAAAPSSLFSDLEDTEFYTP